MKPLFISIWLLVLVFSGCKTSENISDNQINLLDSSSSCPFITSDQNDNPVVSYVAALNDSVSVLRYKISHDEGSTFGPAITIAGSTGIKPHDENLPKVIFKPNHEIIAVWGTDNSNPKNKYAGKVFYSQSFDDGGNWTPATALVKDTNSYDQRYFDVALLPSGEAAIVWLDSRESHEQDGSTIFYSCTSGKNGFVGEKVIEESVCPCCRTELFIDSKGGINVVFRDIINDSIRDMVLATSSDNGASFSRGQRISPDNWVINGCPHTGPAMTESGGKLHFSWFTGVEPAGVFYCNSAAGKQFSKRDSVSNKFSAKHPQVAAMQGDRMAIVWDESVKYGEKNNSRIGFQVRDGNGKVTESRYISADSLVSQFPVIGITAGKTMLVAYTQRMARKSSVVYLRSTD